MRHGLGLVLALTAALGAGCATPKAAPPASWLQRLRPFQGPDAEDAVQMDVALIEVPLGDRSVNDGLWALIAEQLDQETKGVLEENGLRVGQVSAPPPPELLDLLTCERSCPNARRVQLHAGKEGRALDLGPPRARSRFGLRQGGQAGAVELEQAQWSLLVRPALADDGRIRLAFTPQARHAGRGLMPWRPRTDRSGWSLQLQPPTESYAALGWEVTVAANEYVIVGARYDRPGTVGHEAFVRADEPVPVQRLLVVRTARPAGAGPVPAGPGAGGASSRAAPLALQASRSAPRGVCP